MIVAIGTDIVDHVAIEKLHWNSKPNLLKKLFTCDELNIFAELGPTGMRFLYGRFAVKEAVVKCLETGMIDGLPLTDIQVLRGAEGQPLINLKGKALAIANEKKITTWKASISHSDVYSVAFVIAESISEK